MLRLMGFNRSLGCSISNPRRCSDVNQVYGWCVPQRSDGLEDESTGVKIPKGVG